MRVIILAVLVAVGIGLAATPTVNAAPANGVVIGNDAAQNTNITKIQHWRWGSSGRWHRCHARHWSRWYRC